MKAIEAHNLSINRTKSLPSGAKEEYDKIISAIKLAIDNEAAMGMFWDTDISTLVRTRLMRDGYQVIESVIAGIPTREIRWQIIQ